MDKTTLTQKIKTIAYDHGFDEVGIARAEFMEVESRRLEAWLNQGFHGQMAYMANHFDMRVDPRLLVPGAKSVISLSYNYYNPQKQEDPDAPKVSMYAYGQDYHKVIRKKMKSVFNAIRLIAGKTEGRYFVDSAPVMERDWARRSGLGWVGKHTLLINKKRGSYFFLAQLVIDLELETDDPVSDHCGTCTRCIDACPTDAILPQGYQIDASRCISYLTIELKEDIPDEFEGKMDNWMFGCDICQQVCPWNKFSMPHAEPAFFPNDKLMTMNESDWLCLNEEVFNLVFAKSAVKRTKFKGLKRNISFLGRKNH